ncbi:MAG: TAXI family TRAP transporter solute-binding subunit [Desulfosoma sp.]|uniref:TAXI family TRAP transporter solute-binding subunit n=1 Tax=Desulfosoma sp. TaxID=2603217 RepID=UPI00404AE6AB
MKKLALVGMLVMGLFIGQAQAQSAKVLVATGGIGGVYYYYGTQVAEILTKNNAVQATAIQTAASVDNMLLIRDKTDSDKKTYFLATVLPDTAYFTVTGKHEKFGEKPVKANILWMMYPNYLHVVTTNQSGIKNLADLRDKRVSTGAPGSGTEFTALNLLKAAGINPQDFKKWEKLGAKESDEALANGTIDAYFWSGGLPTGSIVELANTLKRKGMNLALVPLPKTDPGVAAFMEEFKGLADPTLISKDVYGLTDDVPTLAFWNMFVGPENLPEDLAYTITKTVFENLDTLHASVKPSKDTTAENTARFVGTTAIPFHPGAVRYFKEKGLVK